MKKSISMLAITLIGGLSICQSALAADSKMSLGLGAAMVPDYEGSEDYTAAPLLYARYSYGEGSYVQFHGTELKWNFLNRDVEFGPLLQYRQERDDVDNNQVDDMDKVDAALAGGFFVTGRVDQFSATLKFATDISGEDTGYTVYLGGDYLAKISDELKMTFGVSTTYASSDYMDIYFGVNNGNKGSSTLSNYDAGGGEFKDIGVHLITNYAFNANWSVVGNINYKRLVGDAADSPLVDDEGSKDQFIVGAMCVYTF